MSQCNSSFDKDQHGTPHLGRQKPRDANAYRVAHSHHHRHRPDLRGRGVPHARSGQRIAARSLGDSGSAVLPLNANAATRPFQWLSGFARPRQQTRFGLATAAIASMQTLHVNMAADEPLASLEDDMSEW